MLKMMSWFSNSGRRAVRRRGFGGRVEALENLQLLSAHAFRHKADNVAAEVAVAKVSPAAKAPADFNGTWPLSGQLDGQSTTGSAVITQSGNSAHVVLNFSGFSQFTNFNLDGTVKGRKLTAEYHGEQNGVSDALFKMKLKKNGDYPWRFFWNDAPT